ncbi:MAG TPA: hypothetical protein VNE40_00840 [Candidatus Dormibacteraeota bacterium]|nr:hypothetical protein [Candidatus Dormibacteraeota bacterium]
MCISSGQSHFVLIDTPNKAIDSINQVMLDQAVEEINTRPRKRLGYQTPEAVIKRNW